MNSIVVVIVGRNSPYISQCVMSVALQSDRGFRVALLDDSSEDGSFDTAKAALKVYGRKFVVVKNDRRLGKVSLYHRLLQVLQPDDFIVNIDADDFFVDRDSIKAIRERVDSGSWCVWGIHRNRHGYSWSIGKSLDAKSFDDRAYIEKIIEDRGRNHWIDHPHCCYAGLLQMINLKDLMEDGCFIDASTDRVLMQPVLEMCGAERIACTRRMIYFYNSPSEVNVSASMVKRRRAEGVLDRMVRKSPYAKLDGHPFNRTT